MHKLVCVILSVIACIAIALTVLHFNFVVMNGYVMSKETFNKTVTDLTNTIIIAEGDTSTAYQVQPITTADKGVHIMPTYTTSSITGLFVQRDALTKFLSTNRKQDKDATITQDASGSFTVTNDVTTTEVDMDRLLKDINETACNVQNKQTYVFRVEKYYKPTAATHVTKEELQKVLEPLTDFYIIYTDGEAVLPTNVGKFFKVSENKLVFNESKQDDLDKYVKEEVDNLEADYDTVGTSISFNSTLSGNIVVSGGTYGDVMDSEAEEKALSEQIKSLTLSDDRAPIMKQVMPDITNTYIEVSIDAQHCWYYKDGKLVMDSDVVTGNKGKHDTPKGVYFISEMRKEKDLRGPGYVSHVHRWMRLTNAGVGLHDATWRSKFGVKIYTYDGSHGCINLPKTFAYDLFDAVEMKTPVIVY